MNKSRKLKAVVFGHIHIGYGQKHARFDEIQRQYEKVRLGLGGIFSILLLFFSLAFGWMRGLLGIGIEREDCETTIRLVNAVVHVDEKEEVLRKPIVFQV